MKFIFTVAFVITVIVGSAQTHYLQVHPGIFLPKDSVERAHIIASLNQFLIAAQQPNEENSFIFEDEKIETFIQLNELKGIEKSGKFKDDFFYKPYLTNVAPLEAGQYLIQFSYIGVHDGMALLRASFECIAHKMANQAFTFSSPLIKNTKNWKVKKAGNTIFHYQNTINKKKVQEHSRLTKAFDTKLKALHKITDYYCTENFVALQKLMGIDYKSDYNGIIESVRSATQGDRQLIVLGNNNATFNAFDPHDLWHDRLSVVVPRSKVYKPVDEACAYLYGGSWGISWKEILQAFKEKVAGNKNTDWREVKEAPLNFGASPTKRLMADYVVNALIIQQLERKKGFGAVWELLNCGSEKKGNELYYRTLEKLTGISKENYNEKIWKLIEKQ